MNKFALTLTTINIPFVIESLIKNEGVYENKVDYIIIGDKKSPGNTNEYLESLQSKYQRKIYYFDIENQVKYFSKYKKLLDHLPLNSFARRNLADLFAFNEGYEIIIRIDDDNFPIDKSFFEYHAVIGNVGNYEIIKSDDGWYNICNALVEKNDKQFYPRGYPYQLRWSSQSISKFTNSINPALCAGLWLGDPDVDAITRLHRPVEASAYNFSAFPNQFALDIGTWSPINTQNTSYLAKLIPAAFVSPFAGRYDDIFSGYFLRSMMDHMGDGVIYGLPLVNQDRNQHDLWSDLDKEIFGNKNTFGLISLLKSYRYSSNSYSGCMLEICDYIRNNNVEISKNFSEILTGMEIWGEIFN